MADFYLDRKGNQGPDRQSKALDMTDDETVIGSNENENNWASFEEIMIQFEFLTKTNDTSKDTAKKHAQILQTMIDQFGGNLVVISNKHEVLEDFEEAITKPSAHMIDFKIQVKNTKRNNQRTQIHYVTHKISTNLKYRDILNALKPTLEEHKSRMHKHSFKESQWNIARLGFLFTTNAVQTPTHIAEQNLTQTLAKEHRNVPVFHLRPTKISAGKSALQRTHAFEIQCLHEEAAEMIKLLQGKQFEDNPIFCPYSYRTNKPDLFIKCVARTNHIIASTWVLKIAGISDQIMDIYHTKLSGIEGFIDVIPAKDHQLQGSWKILVEDKHSHQAYREIAQLNSIVTEFIPQDELNQLPTDYPPISLTSRPPTSIQDDTSSQATYATMLSNATANFFVEQPIELNHELSPKRLSFTHEAQKAKDPTAKAKTGATINRFSPITISDSSSINKDILDSIATLQQENEDLRKRNTLLQSKLDSIETNVTNQGEATNQRFNNLDQRLSKIDTMESQLGKLLELLHTRETEQPHKKQNVATTPENRYQRMHPTGLLSRPGRGIVRGGRTDFRPTGIEDAIMKDD